VEKLENALCEQYVEPLIGLMRSPYIRQLCPDDNVLTESGVILEGSFESASGKPHQPNDNAQSLDILTISPHQLSCLNVFAHYEIVLSVCPPELV